MRTPELELESAVRRWRLTLGERLAGGTVSLVHAVRDGSGRALVIKVPGGRTDPEAVTAAEGAALRAWAGTEVVPTVTAATPRALLLTRARPGTLMPPVDPASLTGVVEAAASILERLWSVDPGPHRYQTPAEAYADAELAARADMYYERRRRSEPDRGELGLRLLPAAGSVASSLLAGSDSGSRALLHGDFISKNLLRDDASPTGYVAIDPLPVIGDPATDVAAFAVCQPAAMILPTVEALARRLGLDQGRVLGWTVVGLVHQITQAWRADQPDLERLAGTAPVQRLLGSGGR